MIAITLFAFFVTAYLTSQGYNVEDSRLSEEQINLQGLAEQKINEIVLNPPRFTNATANLKETKTFEESEFSKYEYTLEIKRVTIPDFAQLFAQKGSASEEGRESYDGDYFSEGAAGQRNVALEKMVFEELRKNIERILWQVRVTIRNKETNYKYTLSTFITNYDERIQLNVGF